MIELQLSACAGAWRAGRGRIAVPLQWDLTAALSGCVRPATTTTILPQKSILNLSVDFVQPLLGAVGFVLIICNLSLEFRDPIFGRPKLMGKLLGQFEGTLTV